MQRKNQVIVEIPRDEFVCLRSVVSSRSVKKRVQTRFLDTLHQGKVSDQGIFDEKEEILG